jgi:hypothetical protein
MRNSTRSIVSLFLFVFVFTFAFMVSVGTPQDAGACVKVCDCTLQSTGCHGAYTWYMGQWLCNSDQCVQPGTCTPYPPCEAN